MFGDLGSLLGRSVRRNVPFTQEDEGTVMTNQGRIPLNQVEGDVRRLQPLGSIGAGVSQSLPQPVFPGYEEAARRYQANPYSSEFSGADAVDPKYFGYPADNIQTQPVSQFPRVGQQLSRGLSLPSLADILNRR